MYLLLLLTLFGSAFRAASSSEVASIDDRAERYLLPTHFQPTFYDIILYFDPNNHEGFTGEVTIRATALTNTNQIVLHAMEMEIANNAIEVFTDQNPTVNLVSGFNQAPDDTHFLRINLSQEVVFMQPISIKISYAGRYAENMFGAYVSTYEQDGEIVSLVTSQLQPTFARRVFPCFDEPALKAIFRITIYAPPTHTIVRTNMPPREDLHKPVIPNWNKYEFQDTPIMSTYLHGFLVSNFENVVNVQEPIFNVTFGIYSRPGTRSSTEFAMDFGQKSMVSLVDYYDFLYYLPKLDKVAVPDFAAGAMENWGLLIYREIALLVTKGVSTTANKQNVARLITHENVHLWIGNEVTPISWTYLWLSEGFATFFDHYALDFVEPTWRMSDQFLLSVQNVFQSDAVLSVNPMTFPVFTPAEVLGTFNAVAYAKSGSVVRMLQHFLTPEVFQTGLRYYIRDRSRKAAAPSDLYYQLQRAANESEHTLPHSVETILQRWVNQGGFPVLTITRSASTANSVVVTQERYLTDRSLNSTDRWHVPVNWVLSTSPYFNDTKPMDWIPIANTAYSIDIPELSAADWYIFNKQQTGYYRVNYDEQNWVALTNALNEGHEIIHVLNRANILDDAFNLARNGRLNYNHALQLSRYLVKEKDYIPWAAVNPSFTYLDVALSASDAYPLFQLYLRTLTAPLYSELGFEETAGEEHVTAFHRNIILDLNCRHGNSNCTDTAAKLLEEVKNNESTLNPDIQTIVYCSALRGGSEDNFNFLWNMYRESSDSGVQTILLNAMGCTSNATLRNLYLNQVISDDSQVREQDRHTIVVSVINSSPEGMDAALTFVHENFHLIQPRVQGLTGTTNILNAFARRLTSQEHSERVEQFAERHAAIFTAGELAAIAGIRENVAASIAWSAENAATVEAWLNENYGSSATAVTASFIVLISVIVTVFNH